MQKSFAICNPAQNEQPVAWLFYETETKQFHITIDPAADTAKLPLSLKMHTEMGRKELDADFAMAWVRARMCPPTRQNISSILAFLDLPEYDEFAILMKTAGKSLMDDLYLDGIVSVI
ncbi:MAG: hypothetical protein FWF83_07135 [Clostridiales bacterium]|nr:hypothetical protein [Clostridiales bacterium]